MYDKKNLNKIIKPFYFFGGSVIFLSKKFIIYVIKNTKSFNYSSFCCFGLPLFYNHSLIWDCISTILISFFLVINLLAVIAIFTLFDRKLMASVQRRRGPDVVGFWGILQPIADGLKLVVKEFILPTNVHLKLFNFAPLSVLVISLGCWAFVPFNSVNVLVDFDLSSLFLFGVSALGVYGVIAAGWASYSRYALLGSLRAVAQLISYEIALSLTLFPIFFCASSLNLVEVVLVQKSLWNLVPFFPLSIIFLVIMLAETNRTPFDLPEAEAELVAGFNVEYSSTAFAMFFLAEYGSMFLMSLIFSIFFLGGWINGLLFFILKFCLVMLIFVLARAALPRYRYDQLMFIGWKVFLPLTFGYILFIIGVLYSLNGCLYLSDLSWLYYKIEILLSDLPLISL